MKCVGQFLTRWYCPSSCTVFENLSVGRGFSTLALLTFGAINSLLGETVLCAVRFLAASPASTHQYHAPTLERDNPEDLWTLPSVPWRRQQNDHWFRTADAGEKVFVATVRLESYSILRINT